MRKSFIEEKQQNQENNFDKVKLETVGCLYQGCDKIFQNKAGRNSHIKYCQFGKKLRAEKGEDQQQQSVKDNLRRKTRQIEKRRK